MRDQLNIMKQAGFQDVEFLGRSGVSTSPQTHGATFRASKPPGGLADDAVISIAIPGE